MPLQLPHSTMQSRLTINSLPHAMQCFSTASGRGGGIGTSACCGRAGTASHIQGRFTRCGLVGIAVCLHFRLREHLLVVAVVHVTKLIYEREVFSTALRDCHFVPHVAATGACPAFVPHARRVPAKRLCGFRLLHVASPCLR